MTNHTRVPPHARSHQKLIFVREEFQHLAETHLHPVRGDPCGLTEQVIEVGIAECLPAKLHQQRLLTQPGLQLITAAEVWLVAHEAARAGRR